MKANVSGGTGRPLLVVRHDPLDSIYHSDSPEEGQTDATDAAEGADVAEVDPASSRKGPGTAGIKVDPDQEQVDIEREMDGAPEADDADVDLFVQALRERLRAAAQLRALGEKLPFGFHFDMADVPTRDVVTFRTVAGHGRTEAKEEDEEQPAAKSKVPAMRLTLFFVAM